MEGGIQTMAVQWQILFVSVLIVLITRGVHSQNPDQPTFTHIKDAEKKGAGIFHLFTIDLLYLN